MSESLPLLPNQVPEKDITESVDVTKRTTLRNILAATTSAAIFGWGGKLLYDEPGTKPLPEESKNDVDNSRVVEAQPVMEKCAEAFVDEIRGYATLLPLRYDEVQFVDEHGAPLGECIRLTDKSVGEDPGVCNAQGIPINGIRSAWLDAARLELQRRYSTIIVDLDTNIPKPYHVASQFRAALKETDEPDLIQGIKTGKITHYRDIVSYFADKPVHGADAMSRLDYVQQKIVFHDTVPASIQIELRKIIPALCVQESGFNNNVTSSSGATGIFQFMPATWAKYSNDPTATSSLRSQVAVAGHFFSDLYSQILHHSGKEALQYL